MMILKISFIAIIVQMEEKIDFMVLEKGKYEQFKNIYSEHRARSN